MPGKHYVRWFEELSIGDVPLVGGKNASLGEMVARARAAGRAGPERLRRDRRGLPGCADPADAWPGCTRHSTGSTRRDVARSPGPAPAAARSCTPPACRAEAEAEVLAAYAALAGGVRRGPVGGGAQLGDGRGPADRELRRPARDLPQRARGGACCWTPCAAARPRCSPTGRSPTGSTRASTISGSPSRWACRRWSAPTSPALG